MAHVELAPVFFYLAIRKLEHMDRMKDGMDGFSAWRLSLLHGVTNRITPTTLTKSRSSAVTS